VRAVIATTTSSEAGFDADVVQVAADVEGWLKSQLDLESTSP
jgi:hypothetical protein